MKTKFGLLLLAFFFSVSWGQAQTATTDPSPFKATDEVTFTVDVTGNAALEGLGEAWAWVWQAAPTPEVLAPSNHNPASSNPALTDPAKFTKVGDNLWEITFVPLTFIGADADISQMGLILKGNDWNDGQTANLFFDVVEQSAPTVSTSPDPFTSVEPVTFTFDVSGDAQLSALNEAWVWTWAPELPNAEVASNVNPASSNPAATAPAKATKIGEGLFEITFVPTDLIDACGTDLARMGIILKGNDWGNGQTSNFYLDVQPAGFCVDILSPIGEPFFANVAQEYPFEVSTTETASIQLFIDGVEVASMDNTTTLSTNFTPSATGTYKLKAVANNGAQTQEREVEVFATPNNDAPVPAGIRPGINYHADDDTKVTLCLIAPNKNGAFAIGDFNGWQILPEHRMSYDAANGYFWIEMDGLTPGQEYIFQYYVDGIQIADPFADKISDPDDAGIDPNVYSGILPFPSSETKGIRASVLQTGQAPYPWEVTDFQKPDADDLVIYELLVRDFSACKCYQGVIDSLDYLQSLNINAIEFMPLNEFEGNNSWGYNPNFYFAPDKAYGTKEKLKELIDEAHKRGIAVILDLVLNHTTGSSPLVQLYPQEGNAFAPGPDNPWYNEFDNIPALSFGPDFNHESTYTQSLVDSINSYWLNEYQFDGFRFDLTKGFGNNFYGPEDPFASSYDADRIRLLERMYDEIRLRDPEAYVIFEHLSENSEEKELADYGVMLWGNMNHDFRELVKGSSTANISWSSYKQRNWNKPNLVSYMESHDEQRMMYDALQFGSSSGGYNVKDIEVATERTKMLAALYLLNPGPKMLWQFQEFGYDIDIDFNGRTGEKPLKWEYLQEEPKFKLYRVFSELIKLKLGYDAFQVGKDDFTYSLNGAVKSVVVNGTDLKVVVVANTGLSNANASLNFPENGTWYDFFSGNPLEVSGNFSKSMALGEWYVFVDREIEFPEEGLSQFVIPLVGNAPENVTVALNSTNDGFELTWADPNDNEDGYTVERSTSNDGTYGLVAALPANTTSYADISEDLMANQAYFYKVSALVGGNSFSADPVQTTSVLTSLEDLKKLGLSVYPNPVKGVLNIRQAQEKVTGVALFGLTGKKVFTTSFETRDEVQRVTLPKGLQGLHILELQLSDQVLRTKLLLE